MRKILIFIVLLAAGCESTTKPLIPADAKPNSKLNTLGNAEAGEMFLPDGRRVICITAYGGGVALSCDWENAK